MEIFKCLESLSDWDPAYAEDVVRQVNEALLTAAEVDEERYKRCRTRVFIDGNYGPIDDDEWKETEGEDEPTLAEALEVIKRAERDFSFDVKFCNYDYEVEEDEDGMPIPNASISSTDFKCELFGFYYEIYGGHP